MFYKTVLKNTYKDNLVSNIKLKNRNQTFITQCIKELKKNGHTICFYLWQVQEIQKKMKVAVSENDGYYFVERSDEL